LFRINIYVLRKVVCWLCWFLKSQLGSIVKVLFTLVRMNQECGKTRQISQWMYKPHPAPQFWVLPSPPPFLRLMCTQTLKQACWICCISDAEVVMRNEIMGWWAFRAYFSCYFFSNLAIQKKWKDVLTYKLTYSATLRNCPQRGYLNKATNGLSNQIRL
jgi:hypothetical protein